MAPQNSKLIAMNTFLLYIRMLLIMIVSLYTVRIVLNTLGVVDYGIYNVVGGVVVLFSFLSGTMASASQRFFSYEIGTNNQVQLARIFNLSLLIYLGIAIVILILAETIGLWFLNNHMVIPINRLAAANWIYQFSILAFIINIIAIPYNAILIAHEDMKIYAYIGIIEVLLKLLIVYILQLFTVDKLKLYAILIMTTTTIITYIYIKICKKKYNVCKYQFYWNKDLFNSLISYSGWNMLGALANVFKIYGSNILLNLFFGPVINAARGIAFQINAALNSFVTNFYMAVRPQITKSFASGNSEYMMQLVFRSAKISYFLLLLLSMPILIETDFILKIWLVNVPIKTTLFIKLLIINILIDSINNQLVAALQATGRIKSYQIVISTLQLLLIPISYFLFEFSAKPEIIFYVSIVISLLSFIPQLVIVHKVIGMSITKYVKEVVLIIIIVTIVSLFFPALLSFYMKSGINRFIMTSLVGEIFGIATIFLIGFTKSEKKYILNIVKTKLSKR